MWGAGASDTKRRRTGTPALTLQGMIDQHRSRLQRECDDVPVLRRQKEALEAKRDRLTRRFEQRLRIAIGYEIEQLDEEIRIRQSRRRFIEFSLAADNFVKAYECVSNVGPNGDASCGQLLSAPGSSVCHSVDSYVQRARANESTKNAIIREYQADVENMPEKLCVRARDTCPFCADSHLLLNNIKSIMVCDKCGYSIVHFDSTISTMSYTDEYDFSTFSYKRISHFEDCMRQVQGKESYQVPRDIIDAVMQQLVLERVDKNAITQAKIRTVLKALRLRRAYDHVAQVYMHIVGRRPPRVSVHVEDTCRSMFIRMQSVFDKHCPKGRKNFLSYNYVLFRLFHILGHEYMLAGFSLLKGKEKLQACDAVFEKIANDLGWKFEPIDAILMRLKK